MKTMVNHFVISIEFLKILCNPYPLLPLDGAQLLANRSLIRGNVGSYPKQIFPRSFDFANITRSAYTG